MNQHLSDRELAQWLAGTGDSRLSNHLADCEPCRQEGEALRAAVGEFRNQVQQAGERDEFHWSRQRHTILAAAERDPSHRLRWAVSLVMGVAALSTVLLMTPHRVPVAPVSDDRADEQLLLAVQSDLSRTAPEALAPAEVLQQERATMLAQLEEKNERRTTQ